MAKVSDVIEGYTLVAHPSKKGITPPHLVPYLLKKGDVKPIVEECRARGKKGSRLVECIFQGVARVRRKKISETTEGEQGQ